MVRTAKIALSLPKPVLTWLQTNADERYVDVEEHIRALIVDLYVRAQHVQDHSLPPDQGGSGHIHGGYNKPKSRGPRSGYKGVYRYGQRWAAVMSLGGEQKRIAVCDTPEEAARAYDRAMVERAGGNPRAAVNAIASQGRTAFAVDAPYVEKLSRGEALSDVEIAAWRKASSAVPESEAALPVSVMTTQVNATGPLVRRQLRRGSAPAIERPPDPPFDVPTPTEET